MTGDHADLDEEAAARAEHVRRKRVDRADPEGRIDRVRGIEAPPEDVDLPATDGSDDGDGDDAPDGAFAAADLPAGLREDVERTRKKLAFGLREEFDVEMDPVEQFWPLVAHLGVERLKSMWLEEVLETFEDVDGLELSE